MGEVRQCWEAKCANIKMSHLEMGSDYVWEGLTTLCLVLLVLVYGPESAKGQSGDQQGP